MDILSTINNAQDVKKLNNDQLNSLAQQIRQTIIDTTSKNGGHLSSNLGIVDTTIALYKTFDFPNDKLIFDVGHQCYAHKILSGRKNEFSSIRLDNGLSGFPNVNESEFDPFTTGHAGTSISAGLGYCMARDKLQQDYTVVCVVGDGSFSNGLNLEALFSSNTKPKNFIVILNDNGMSISKNKNGLYRFISKSTVNRGYVGSKKAILKIFKRSFITRILSSIKNFIKRLFNYDNYFENYGFKYVGVIDGNNMREMTKVLQNVKKVAKDKAVLLHLKTTKGKGYKDAEMHADAYHGVGSNFVCESGSFALALGQKLNQLIQKDNRIFTITAGMKDGTGLVSVEKEHPENFIDVGIAEEYAVTLASGMARGGLKPIVAIYSTFLQRAYDQLLHDVCLQNLPIVFCLDRAGLVGNDGETHQGVFDLSYLSHMPNMTILAPNTSKELEDALEYALSLNSPVAIRYPKSQTQEQPFVPLKEGLWRVICYGKRANVLAVGPRMLSVALECAENIEGLGVISARTIKPLDKKVLLDIKDKPLIILEENSQIGGFASLVGDFYSQNKITIKTLRFGVGDKFIKHGSVKNQLANTGLDSKNITQKILEFID